MPDTPTLSRTIPAILLVFFLGCTNSRPGSQTGRSAGSCDISLILPTADGLQAGDPILFKDKKVGQIARLSLAVNQMEACAQFEKEFRPAKSARFELVRGEEGDRFIRIIDGDLVATPRPTSEKVMPGEKIQVRLPLETLEDRLWISR